MNPVPFDFNTPTTARTCLLFNQRLFQQTAEYITGIKSTNSAWLRSSIFQVLYYAGTVSSKNAFLIKHNFQLKMDACISLRLEVWKPALLVEHTHRQKLVQHTHTETETQRGRERDILTKLSLNPGNHNKNNNKTTNNNKKQRMPLPCHSHIIRDRSWRSYGAHSPIWVDGSVPHTRGGTRGHPRPRNVQHIQTNTERKDSPASSVPAEGRTT